MFPLPFRLRRRLTGARSFAPVLTKPELTRRTGLTALTVNRALAHLCELGIIRELTGQKRKRVFSYAEYMAILNEGTELPE